MITTALIVLVVLATAIVLVQALMKFIGFIATAIVKAPGKGVRKVFNFFKGVKAAKAEKAMDKALLEADTLARLNAARQNPNYKVYPKVKRLIAKQDLKEAKKALKK